MNRKYIFKCKLEGEPVCIVADLANGVYGDLLEECGVWHRAANNDITKTTEFCWIVDYPLIIKHNDTRYDLEVGYTFTLS